MISWLFLLESFTGQWLNLFFLACQIKQIITSKTCHASCFADKLEKELGCFTSSEPAARSHGPSYSSYMPKGCFAVAPQEPHWTIFDKDWAMLSAVTWARKVVVVQFHEGSHKAQRDCLVSRRVCVSRHAGLSTDVSCTLCTPCFMPYSNANSTRICLLQQKRWTRSWIEDTFWM